MEKIKAALKHAFSSKTALGRTVRTFLQAIIAIAGFTIAITALPGLMTFVSQNNVTLATSIASAVAIVTAVWNGAEKLLVWLNTVTE